MENIDKFHFIHKDGTSKISCILYTHGTLTSYLNYPKTKKFEDEKNTKQLLKKHFLDIINM